jgi:hypothetical protein
LAGFNSAVGLLTGRSLRGEKNTHRRACRCLP